MYFLLQLSSPTNPFDINAKSQTILEQTPLHFVPILISSIAITVLFTVFRPLMIRSLNAIISINKFKQLTKDIYSNGISDFILPLIVSLYTPAIFGKFIFESLSIFQIFISLIVLLSLKIILIQLSGKLFDISKASNLYISTIIIFYIGIGILLVPINLFLMFPGSPLEKILFNTGYLLIILMFSFRYLRATQVNLGLVSNNKFHFLLYICTVEIGPFLVIYKLISDQLIL